jgi:hypothetical protein
MRKTFSWNIIIGVLILLISVFAVKSVYLTAKPTVDTAQAQIKEGEATLEGVIHNTGGKDISDYGFKWGTSKGLDEKQTLSGSISAKQPFSTTIKELQEGVTYYYRAYAANPKGIAYGDVKSFTLPVKYNAPPVVSIASPEDNLTVDRGEVVKIAASAADDKSIETMELYINDASKTKAGKDSLAYDWDTSSAAPGKYVLKITAGDGNKSDEKAVTLTVKDESTMVSQVADSVSPTSKTASAAKTASAVQTAAAKTAVPTVSPTPSRGGTSNNNKYPQVSKVNGAFGQFRYRDTSGGRIEIDPQWVAENIVTIKLPGLNRYVEVHKDAKDNFIQAFKYIENGTATINGKKVPLLSLIKTMDGTFVARHVNWNPARGLSNHSWGTAIDINAADHFRYVDPAREPYDPNYILWEKAFKPAGFSWGNSYADSMHYELFK